MGSCANSREFLSNDTGVDKNDYAVTVGFARDLSNEESQDAFMVQRSLDPNEDKRGEAGVYIEVPPQKYATYGGIVAATLHRDAFELLLTVDGARQMGGIGRFLAHFKLDATKFAEVQDALRLVFANCACYREAPTSSKTAN